MRRFFTFYTAYTLCHYNRIRARIFPTLWVQNVPSNTEYSNLGFNYFSVPYLYPINGWINCRFLLNQSGRVLLVSQGVPSKLRPYRLYPTGWYLIGYVIPKDFLCKKFFPFQTVYKLPCCISTKNFAVDILVCLLFDGLSAHSSSLTSFGVYIKLLMPNKRLLTLPLVICILLFAEITNGQAGKNFTLSLWCIL